jgi:hypothetical protein
MALETVTKRVLAAARIVISALGIVLALIAVAVFLHASGIVSLEGAWPAVDRVLPPLDEWRQISALLIAAWGIAIQFMRPEKLPDRLAIRKGVEDTDTRGAEKRQTGWMLALSTVFVALWVGLLEVPSRGLVSPEGRAFLLAGAVVVQSAALFWLLRAAGQRQKRLIESHWAEELARCPRSVRALMSPGVGLLLGVGTLALWVGLVLAIASAAPQVLGLPQPAQDHSATLAAMRLTADELLDTIFLGIPAEYGLVLGRPEFHSWVGATILVAFRFTVGVSLFLTLYLAIRARHVYAGLARQVLRESSEEAGRALARVGRPAAGRLVREALRLRATSQGDSAPPAAKTLLLQAMYDFYHPRILQFALRQANDPGALDGDRVEALKYVCTYGDQQTALGLLERFFHSGNQSLREAVSLVCVAFAHADCNQLLDEMGRAPQTAGEYRNAVLCAGVRLADEPADSVGVSACLQALPGLFHLSDPAALPMREGVFLLASFAAPRVAKAIEAEWPKMSPGTKLYCLDIVLKIRAGLLPDPQFLGSVLNNTESAKEQEGSDELWRYVTQEDVACLIEISQCRDLSLRSQARDALAEIGANRADLIIDMPLEEGMLAPADEPDSAGPDAEALQSGLAMTEEDPREMQGVGDVIL